MKRMTGIFLFCMIFIFAGCGGKTTGRMYAAACYQKGVASYEDGAYAAAAEHFATAVDKGLPEELTVYAYSYLGHCHAKCENYEAAEAWYQSALATGAEAAMCNTNLGIFFRGREDYEAAEQYYQAALRADASYTQALVSLGVLYSVSGRAEEAVPLLEEAISLEAEAPAVYYADLAYAYARTGAFAEAWAQLETAEARGYLPEHLAALRVQLRQLEGGQTGEAENTVKEDTDSDAAVTIPPTVTPSLTATPVPVVSPTTAVNQTEAKRKIVVLDPGHQSRANYEKEPIGPGAAELKIKVSAGTQGATTKVPEHQFNLELSLKLRDALEALGYQVVLTRETAEVDISNAERAVLANEAKADIFVRIHADGAENKAANGISVLYPSEKNPYIAELSADSKRLAEELLDGMCESTGANRRGIVPRDDLTGMNWSKVPVVVIEAGFMTNAAEEQNLISDAYQELLAEGVVKGIQEYFGE